MWPRILESLAKLMENFILFNPAAEMLGVHEIFLKTDQR